MRQRINDVPRDPRLQARALLVVPLLRMPAPRRAAMLRYAGTGGHVFEPLVDHPRSHIGRRLADQADRPYLVDQQLPDLPGGPVALLQRLARGRAEHREALQQSLVGRLDADRAVARIPLRVGGAAEARLRIDRQHRYRVEIHALRAVVAPQHDLVLVVAYTRVEQAALEQPHVGEDADRFPLLHDHLGLLRPGRRERLRDVDLQPQPFAVVGAHAETLGVALLQADRVEHRVRLGDVEHRPCVAPLLAGTFHDDVRGDRRAGYAEAEEERFVDLVAVNAERERPAEFAVGKPFLD